MILFGTDGWRSEEDTSLRWCSSTLVRDLSGSLADLQCVV